MRRLLTTLTISLSLGTATVAGGCYGSFALSKKLHKWNGEVSEDKFINSLVFLGLVIVPVYEISLLVDFLVFNTVEFWSGDNPVDSGSVAMLPNEDGSLTVHRDGKSIVVSAAPDGAIQVFERGVLVGSATRGADGSLTVHDMTGTEVGRFDRQVLDALAPVDQKRSR